MAGEAADATIYAVATPPGVGGVAVIRVSGLAADAVLLALTARALPAPRRATRRRLVDEDGEIIDDALVLRFEPGRSFTGEAVAELHCHGGRAVVQAVLARLSRIPGCRLAEAGEFTRRALLNGRLDLAEVEALGDLIAAETEAQRRLAARALSGAVHRRVEDWRARLIEACVLTEVTLDWADEDVPSDVLPQAAKIIERLIEDISAAIDGARGAERLRQGFEVAILGAPNAGKSSFINVLAGREAAIASPVPGTTRDVIELRYDLRGLPVTFLDMAGLRETDDPVERVGVEKAVARATGADLRLFLTSLDAPLPGFASSLRRPGDLHVWTKVDCHPAVTGARDQHAISAKTGAGVPELVAAVHGELVARVPADAVMSHERQRSSLIAARSALVSARDQVWDEAIELIAQDLRTGLQALDRLLGRSGTEEVLGAVFRNFCLGK